MRTSTCQSYVGSHDINARVYMSITLNIILFKYEQIMQFGEQFQWEMAFLEQYIGREETGTYFRAFDDNFQMSIPEQEQNARASLLVFSVNPLG